MVRSSAVSGHINTLHSAAHSAAPYSWRPAFVNEDQPRRIKIGLNIELALSSCENVGAILLRGVSEQSFFPCDLVAGKKAPQRTDRKEMAVLSQSMTDLGQSQTALALQSAHGYALPALRSLWDRCSPPRGLAAALPVAAARAHQRTATRRIGAKPFSRLTYLEKLPQQHVHGDPETVQHDDIPNRPLSLLSS